MSKSLEAGILAPKEEEGLVEPAPALQQSLAVLKARMSTALGDLV